MEVAAALDDLYAVQGIAGAASKFVAAKGEKCARCWMVLEEVASHPQTHLCNRCTDAVAVTQTVPA